MTAIGQNAVPQEYALDQNYPNPFNPTTTIGYQIPKDGHVKLQLFNILGALVVTLDDQVRTAGYYRTTFDAGGIASGVYVYRLQVGGFVASKKLLLLR